MRFSQAWAKFSSPQDGGEHAGEWHSLIGHSIDVACVFDRLQALPAYTARLNALAGWPLSDEDHARLAALAMLHDLGKANIGFQAKALPFEQRKKLKLLDNVGHTREVAGLFAETLQERALQTLPLEEMAGWFGGDSEAFTAAFIAVLSHHGKPITVEKFCANPRNHICWWQPRGGYDPFAELARLTKTIRASFPLAFDGAAEPLPNAPRFWHAIAGMLQLADWIGSHKYWFPFANGEDDGRLTFAREHAAKALSTIGLDLPSDASARPARAFGELFQDKNGQALPPYPMQAAAGDIELSPITLIESETGSGKTEAALWRFARLYAAGKVDALYFALPTRVAASQIYDRVREVADRLFGDEAPPIVLAIPGQARLDGVSVENLLPEPKVLHTDDADDPMSARRWAAERPKRFLAAPVAVGTIDQALLSALQVKHAHLRHASLMRSLLIIDEVHASDIYMTALSEKLLANHAAAGGHALLMSATLGSAARARLLAPGKKMPPTPLAKAEKLAYPMLWNGEAASPQQRIGRNKTVALSLAPYIAEPDRLAELAGEHCAAGAKVLVIRNTVAAAQQTQSALEARLGPEHPALFRCEGAATLHHGRFSRADRRLLDRAVEEAIGKTRPDGALVVVGSQTLEISLDLDADILITDLCPVDVLLQRIGRLHRHHERARPAGYEAAQAIVLTPTERDLAASCGQFGLGPFKTREGYAGIYENLFALEATWGLLADLPEWHIPEMNRMLVERATHPEIIEALRQELAAADPQWEAVYQHLLGSGLAQRAIAEDHSIDMAKPFEAQAFPDEEKVLTRLGAADRVVRVPEAPEGPFGEPLAEISIPGHWKLAEILPSDAEARAVSAENGAIILDISEKQLIYDRLGLRIQK